MVYFSVCFWHIFKMQKKKGKVFSCSAGCKVFQELRLQLLELFSSCERVFLSKVWNYTLVRLRTSAHKIDRVSVKIMMENVDRGQSTKCAFGGAAPLRFACTSLTSAEHAVIMKSFPRGFYFSLIRTGSQYTKWWKRLESDSVAWKKV